MSKFRKKFVHHRFDKLSSMLVAKKALRKVKSLARKVKPELKIFDLVSTINSPTIAGTISNIVGLVQGVGETQRVGLQIRSSFFEFRFTIVKHATPVSTNVRIMIVRDNRQVESTNPSVLDILLAATPNSQKSRVNPKRFTVLYNRFFTLNTTTVSRVFTKTKRITFPIRWIGAGAGDITKNGIFLLTESDAVGGQEPFMKFTWRFWFSDV